MAVKVSVTRREEHRRRVFQGRVQRMVVVSGREEVTGDWRKPRDEFSELCCSKNIWITRSRRIRWVKYVARMGRTEVHAGFS